MALEATGGSGPIAKESSTATSKASAQPPPLSPPDPSAAPMTSPTTSDGNPKMDAHASAKMKRIACILCRKRKLKCDGAKPSCGTCSRLGHNCAYDEVRRKSGPKRGYVKALEARLAQVETMLKTQEPTDLMNDAADTLQVPTRHNEDAGWLQLGDDQNVLLNEPAPTFSADKSNMNPINEPFSWDMIALGLEEPLPNQSAINELNNAYFEKVHHSLPMIHRARFLAAMDLAPHMRPPICLRYAMWALAAGTIDKFEPLEEQFYHRSRKYIQLDELRGHGESIITLAHTQTWVLLCMYEVKHMYFPRSWLSTGRAVRLAQMLGLHRLDGVGLDVKQCLPPPRDWTEREERRRTFWAAYSEDRCASIGTGWPMTIEEQDILTNLPAPEDAFQNNRPVRTMSLQEATESANAEFSSFAGVALMSTLFGRNLTHLHRPGPDDFDDDLNGAFWKRHRSMDSILLNKALALPDYLRLPAGIGDPNVIFLNMCIHTSAICLHQAAIFKADKNQMPAAIATESKVRCITAAAEVASIMRSVCHLDLATMNPFMAFCLYVAARVFIQYLKSRPQDQQILSSLHFLLSAMNALKRKNPLTESFLVQLEVDMEGTGIAMPASSTKNSVPFGPRAPPTKYKNDAVNSRCSPLINIAEGQQDSPETIGRGYQSQTRASPYSEARSFQVVDLKASGSRRPHDSASGHGSTQWQGFRKANGEMGGDADGMDLSPDDSVEHPTPSSTSHHGPSSHTSFTPPETLTDYDMTQKSTYSLPTQAQASAAPGENSRSAASDVQIPLYPNNDFNGNEFIGIDPNIFPPTSGIDPDFNFNLPHDWDFTVEQNIASNSPAGWNQILQAASGWDSTLPFTRREHST